MKCLGGRVVSALDLRLQGLRFESRCRGNSIHDCMALHCTEPFIMILPSSQYNLSTCNIERNVKHQIIIIRSACSH